MQSLKRIDELTGGIPGGKIDRQRESVQHSSCLIIENQVQKSNDRYETPVVEEILSGSASLGHKSAEQSPEHLTKGGTIQGIESERKWLSHVKKIYNAIHNMDKNKYLEPKFSMSLYPVVKYLYKKYGAGLAGGSTVSNLSMLSQSQRGGGPPGFTNCNDSFSLSSLISGDTKKVSDISGGGISVQNQNNSRLAMYMDDQKTNENNYPVMEQSIEDDEEEKSAKKGNSIIANGNIEYQPNQLIAHPAERSQSENLGYNHSGIQMKVQETSPGLLEPILKGKFTSRTIQRQSYLMAEGLEQFLREPPKRITDTVYQDRKDINQRGTPKKNTAQYKKKHTSRALQNYVNSYNAGPMNSSSESHSMMENAYKTSYSFAQKQNSSQIMRNINIQQSSSAYGQFPTNSGNNTSAYQSRKGQKFIRTLIEQKAATKGSSLQPSQNVSRNLQDLNKDMHHMKSLKTIQLNPNSTVEEDYTLKQHSPDSAVTRSYYNAKTYAHPAQDESVISQGRSDSSRQYSAISVKRVSMLNSDGPKSEIGGGGGSSFMFVRKNNQSRGEGKKDKSSSFKSGRRNIPPPDQYAIASLAFAGAYQQSPRLALQVIDNPEIQEGPSSSQRSLQKNYLTNLNELVKIHQEMKKHAIKVTTKGRK